MGNQQGTLPPASYPSHHYKRGATHSPQPTVVINFPKGGGDDKGSSNNSNQHQRSRTPEPRTRSHHNFLGIPLPVRTRRHSEASATRLDVSNSDLYQDSLNAKEGKNKLLQVPGVYHRQRRKSVDNSAFNSSSPANTSYATGSSQGSFSSKFTKPSMDSLFGIGRRSRRSSMIDQEPIQIKTTHTNTGIIEVPVRERYFETMETPSKPEEPEEDPVWSKFPNPDMNTRKRRTRAVSMVEHNHSYNKDDDANREKIPTVFKYFVGNESKRLEKVFVTGNMTNWTCVQMCQPKGESDYYSIIGCRTGDAIFKFYVDGEWTYNKDEEAVKQSDNFWNILKVQESDCDVFNALACDSLVLKDNRKKPNDEDRKESNAWGQEKPSEDVITSYKNKGPPGLPPHLLQVLLNKEPVSNNSDPVILHEPLQVSLNHLYAQSIRDNMLVLSTTHRFRKKCVTLVLYKPI